MSCASQQCTPPHVTQGPEGRWSQGSVRTVSVDCVCRLYDCSFLASGVCALVGEAGLEASVCPLLVGPGSWPFGGQVYV